jgi:hypothetical protein
MGHAIQAFLKSDAAGETVPAIAELHRGAFNPLNTVIYKALKCVENNYCGVSGCGTYQEFTLAALQEALGDIAGEEDLRPEIDFLNDCIDADDESGFVIHFF